MAPTPESAAFLAKKPTVPPTFDGVDYDDTQRLKQAQDAVIREQWVKSMMARLVREELGKCYYKNGVNHLEKCGALRAILYIIQTASVQQLDTICATRLFHPPYEISKSSTPSYNHIMAIKMICRRCLRRASTLRINQLPISRTFTTSPRQFNAASTPNLSETFSTPLADGAQDSTSKTTKPKQTATVVSSAPAGTVLKGLNYFKGKDDPVALADEEYPPWLWGCLESAKTEEAAEAVGDEFSKSKKLRRKAAKAARKAEARALATGDIEALVPKVPIQNQSIDLPSNTEGTIQGALDAVEKRDEVRKAMRAERRKKIKESNFLKSM
ncbi:putative NADH-ubiquinone oxidoreductase 12 kDa subunit, mitochondrial [Xylogone sp. PMI_703]|nr:putative NADH-ubiquinone oxidoreductase 12 kDa subunit, mitochondrial [Xylogone sp. PMI_703]